MVVRRAALAADLGHCFACRFSIADTHFDRVSDRSGDELKSAVQFLSVVEKDRRMHSVSRFHDAVRFRGVIVAVGLPVTRFQQDIGKTHTGITLPYDPGR